MSLSMEDITIKVCVVCEKSFTATGRHLTCSPLCSAQNTKNLEKKHNGNDIRGEING